MSRYFMIQSWVGSHENEPDYNGQQCGERNVRSIEAVPLYDQYGNANVAAFSDEAITARGNIDGVKKRKTSIPLRQRILPQESRLNTLDAQIEELNQEYNSNRMSHEEYTQLKTILQRKRDRAWELYVKAGGVAQNNDESEEFGVEYTTQKSVTEVGCGVAWVDELSAKNTFKKMLQNTCKAFKLAVHYKHKTSSYLQTLKDL